jgi:hypothetical protein
MKTWLAVVAAAAALLIAAVLLVSQRPAAESSVLSRQGRGWLAARRYLEEQGCRTVLDDGGRDPAPGGSVLVLAFPWQSFGADDDDLSGRVSRRLQRGGAVVFAYSGKGFSASESLVAEGLGLGWQDRRGRAPLLPWRWRAFAAAEDRLLLEGDRSNGLRAGRVTAPRRVPEPPAGSTVLARDAGGVPLAFSYPRGPGRVVVLPADAFANSRLGRPGNADLLEGLRRQLGAVWVFDEYHHGLRPPVTAQATRSGRVVLLFLLQLGFLYGLLVVALARRFGPAWREELPSFGSAAGLLVGLGALHDRLGHQGDAASLLLSRACALDGRLALPVADAAERRDLLRLARRVGQAQARRANGA